MQVDDFSDFELQKMRLAVKDVSRLAKFFEGDEEGVKNYILNTTKAPVSYIKELDLSLVISLICEKTYKGAAVTLGVSAPFLHGYVKTELKKGETVCSLWSLTERDGFYTSSKEDVLQLKERIPYVTLLAAVTFWNKTRLRKMLGKSKIGTENELSSARGRRAELVYKKFRGEFAEEDMNEKDSRSTYDFVDREFKRVNVKSVKAVKLKSGQRRWYFSLQGGECDYYALIGYEELGEVPIFIKMLKYKEGVKGTKIDYTKEERAEFIYDKGVGF